MRVGLTTLRKRTGWWQRKGGIVSLSSSRNGWLRPRHDHAGVTSTSIQVVCGCQERNMETGHCLIYESPEPKKLSFGYVGPESMENLKFIDDGCTGAERID